MPVKAKSKPRTKIKTKGKTKKVMIKKPTKAKRKTAKSKMIAVSKTKKVKAVKGKAKPKTKAKKKVVKKPTSTMPTTAKAKVSSLGPIGFKPYKLEKDEEYMNEAQQAHFRHILLLWKQQLLEEFDRTKQHMQNDAANFADPLDRATQEEEFNFELRTRDRERKLVKKIEDALERISNNEYGYCTDCGAEIGIRRLEARPTATQCIDCKTFEEIKERQTGTA